MVRKLSIVALASLALAGCSDSMASLETAPKPPQLNFTGDTFCRQMSYIDPETGKRVFAQSWEPTDTPQTIYDVETTGTKYEKVCEGKAAAKSGDLPALK
jgi:hypothetical protein